MTADSWLDPRPWSENQRDRVRILQDRLGLPTGWMEHTIIPRHEARALIRSLEACATAGVSPLAAAVALDPELRKLGVVDDAPAIPKPEVPLSGSVASSVITAPEPYGGTQPAIFLAGGITGCEDWQSRAAAQIAHSHGRAIAVLNPRRERFEHSHEAAVGQIHWEYVHLRAAQVVLFWFCEREIQPIALFELGAHSAARKPLAVGAHPEYPRRLDVLAQLRLARPEVLVSDTLEQTVQSACQLIEATA